jgi:hypothetical protein
MRGYAPFLVRYFLTHDINSVPRCRHLHAAKSCGINFSIRYTGFYQELLNLTGSRHSVQLWLEVPRSSSRLSGNS